MKLKVKVAVVLNSQESEILSNMLDDLQREKPLPGIRQKLVKDFHYLMTQALAAAEFNGSRGTLG